MKTGVIYARYSSDSQTEQSIEGQLRVCEEFAQKNNILILGTYIDRAMTGTNDNRPDFRKMIADSSKREWDYVICYKLDRFSRNKYETTIHKKTLKDNGVKVLSAMENIPDTPEGIILESLLEGMNQYYSAELAQKVKRGMYETRRKGYYQGGGLPYGYKIDGRKIVIDDDAAEVVRYMYDQYAKGTFVKDIIEELTNRGVLHRGKPFAKNTVYGILKNERYSGIYRHGDEVIENMFPRIVSAETFQLVRAKVKKNEFGKRSIKTVYLLRGKVKCGYCGMPISAETGTTRQGVVIHYYKCLGKKKYSNGCVKTQIRKEFLEEFVLNCIIEELSKPKMINYIVANLMKIQDEKNTNQTLNLLLKEKGKVDKALDNIANAIENGIISNTTDKRLHDLEKQQEILEREILIERSKLSVKITENVMRTFYADALRQEPQMLIEMLVKEVILYNDKAEIIFNTPTRMNLDESQGFSLCSFIGNMHYKKQNVHALQNLKMFVEMYIR